MRNIPTITKSDFETAISLMKELHAAEKLQPPAEQTPLDAPYIARTVEPVNGVLKHTTIHFRNGVGILRTREELAYARAQDNWSVQAIPHSALEDPLSRSMLINYRLIPGDPDGEPTGPNYDDLNINELRRIASDHGLPTAGKKADIVDRLKEEGIGPDGMKIDVDPEEKPGGEEGSEGDEDQNPFAEDDNDETEDPDNDAGDEQ